MNGRFQPPMRTGLLDFFRNSAGCQFVIPVYQRNYTWTAGKEVRQFLEDLEKVLKGHYNNHFLGIMIYLDKPIDHTAREFSVIDGQQRLTTTFLILYAVKDLLQEAGLTGEVKSLVGQYLTNPFASEKVKYKLKPLVADDEVYQHIVADELGKINDKESNVFKNYVYIQKRLRSLITEHTSDELLTALNKLYIVCVPLSDDDDPQKIFESINATGVKLTASDLIRNFLLMDMPSEQQERYYAKYWKDLERLMTSDAKKLEAFFRFFLAVQEKTLPNKNAVYKLFVEWYKGASDQLDTEETFELITSYADSYFAIYRQDLAEIAPMIRGPIREFRRILSDMPAPLLMELYGLYKSELVSGSQLAEMMSIVNSYLIRRALCDLDTSSITRLFPALLKDILVDCDGDYAHIVESLKRNLIAKNIGNAMFMPDDVYLADAVYNANMYNIRATLRLFLDKLEHHNNSAPVELGSLSIEHIMPQTPTNEWYEELGVDEETYQRNVHRLGNLTLASKSDNSSMKNEVWAYKNHILSGTSHLKINEELLKIEHWTIDEVEKRTRELTDRMKELYPYPKITKEMVPKVPIFIRRTDLQARGFLYLDNGSVEVDVGSQLHSSDNAENYPDIADLRHELLDDDVIAETEEGLEFIKPYIFYSKWTGYSALSLAAGVILHGARNGWQAWVDDSGVPLGDIADIRSRFS